MIVQIKSGPPGVGQLAIVGPITGTRSGVPAPLPGPVVFSLASGADLGELLATTPDSIDFVTRDEYVSGQANLVIEAGSLTQTITFDVVPGKKTADTLVVPTPVIVVNK